MAVLLFPPEPPLAIIIRPERRAAGKGTPLFGAARRTLDCKSSVLAPVRLRRAPRRSLRCVERALPARGVEGELKRPDRFHRQDPIHDPGIVLGDRPHLRLVFRVVEDQPA